MTADPRQQQAFEYMLQSNSIFPEVNIITTTPARASFFPGTPQHEYSNAINAYATSTSNGLFAQGVSQEELVTSPLQIDTDDVDFAPTVDGELTSGCRKCGIDYGSSTELKLHFGAVHSRQTFECCVCNKLFIRRHGFLVHIKKFHEDVTVRSYPCPFCEQIYTSAEAMNEHVAIQHKEPNQICPLCSMQVPPGGIKMHIEKEHTAMPTEQHVHQEEHCDVISTLVAESVDSKKDLMPLPKVKRRWPVEKTHQCTLCPYESNRAERLRVHVQGVHHDQRGFPCNACDKSFKQKDKLNRHINSVHLRQKPYQCDFCNMSFARKDEQVRHSRIVHMGEKPKKADKKAVILSASSVDQDLLLVEEDFPNQQCPHCPYHTDRSDKLKTHLLSSHSEERPFPCNFCDKRFKLKDKLNLHVNNVHLKRKPFECANCGQVFGRKDAAKRHEKLWCSLRLTNPAVMESIKKETE